jgi:hypothetical protein
MSNFLDIAFLGKNCGCHNPLPIAERSECRRKAMPHFYPQNN